MNEQRRQILQALAARVDEAFPPDWDRTGLTLADLVRLWLLAEADHETV